MGLFSFFKSRKSNNNLLKAALIECKKANDQGYEEANVYIEKTKSSIEKATKIINDCVASLRKHRINDPSIIKNVTKQLQVVQTEFENSFDNMQSDLLKKSQKSSNFNITLFGRTKSGKSTLMEILIHGDGSEMGHGGQRTTRDVRSYDWQGMSITDVPGIDAYGGQEDDEIAQEAATFADLILFMITAGQPESTEADWMVKLKRMDKPMICICNFKQSLGTGLDDIRLKRFLQNPEKLEERMNISELTEQFNLFLKEQLPYEHVDFIITHLLAKFYSQQKEYKKYRDALETASRFADVENAIINEVLTNGVLHRKKCYLSIIDTSLYYQMRMLFDFSRDSYSQFHVIRQKKTDFESWCDKFNRTQKAQIKRRITMEFDKIHNSVPGFVERHSEDESIEQSWSEHCQQFDTEKDINKILNLTRQKLDSKINETFKELDAEMKFVSSYNKKASFGRNPKITNWKKVWRWTGAIGGAGLTIASFFFPVLAPFAIAVPLISWFFSLFSGSRESKLRERRKQLSTELNKVIDNNKNDAIDNAMDWYEENIIKKQHDVINRLRLISNSMLSLSCGQRELALGYSKNHTDITKKIVSNALNSMSVPEKAIQRITCAARVPGRRLAIVVKGEKMMPFAPTKLSKLMGHEYVDIIISNPSHSIKFQLVILLKRLHVCDEPKFRVFDVYDGKQTVVYLSKQEFNQEQLDSIELIQQILNIHIILKSTVS